jgi:hypothetical protein
MSKKQKREVSGDRTNTYPDARNLQDLYRRRTAAPCLGREGDAAAEATPYAP